MTLSNDVGLEEYIMSKVSQISSKQRFLLQQELKVSKCLSGISLSIFIFLHLISASMITFDTRKMNITQKDFVRAKENVLYRKKQGGPEVWYM